MAPESLMAATNPLNDTSQIIEIKEISKESISYISSKLQPLIGMRVPSLALPKDALINMEPGALGTLAGSVIDAALPDLGCYGLKDVGLKRSPGHAGQRASYPDYTIPGSTLRAEHKALYVAPLSDHVTMNVPPTPREASGRIKENIRIETIDAENDALIISVYRFDPQADKPEIFSPKIIDVGVFPMIEIVRARDYDFNMRGGLWFDNGETPAVVSKQGQAKLARGERLNKKSYGNKKNGGCDYNKDTNFGKLERIPYKPLHELLKKHGLRHISCGGYPEPWSIASEATSL